MVRKIAFVVIVCLLLFVLVYSYYNKNCFCTDRKSYVLFQDSNSYLQHIASGLEVKLQEPPELSIESQNRINNAIKMLKNKVLDEKPILIEAVIYFNAELDDNNSPVLQINYIDEIPTVAKIAYRSNGGTMTNLPLSHDDFAKIFQFAGANFNWIFILKEGLNNDQLLFKEIKNTSYLILPENIWESVLRLEGEIILLDKEDNVLDFIKITGVH